MGNATENSHLDRAFLEKKRVPFTGKTTFLHDTIVKLIHRFPKRFDYDIFPGIQHFLTHTKEEFRQLRTLRQSYRIVCSHYLFQKSLEHEVKISPHRRFLCLKLLPLQSTQPKSSKKILGLSIAMNSLKDYECFELRHILGAIQRVLPHAQFHSDSYFSQWQEESRCYFLYLEIENENGDSFTLAEIKKLKNDLPNELKNSIEYLSPSLFMPRNEDALIQNIINLSTELRTVKDIPQAIISFEEQRGQVLKFNVILLRVLVDKDRSLLELSRQLPHKVQFLPERVANVGYIRSKTVKEANVFSIEVETQPFLRKNHSIDLVKARQYVVKLLEKMIGNFRDFNGTILLKQNKQLEEIKTELGIKGKNAEFLLENLFYSLSPSSCLENLPKTVANDLSILFLKTLEQDLPENKECHLELIQDDHTAMFVLKTALFEVKDKISASLENLHLDPHKLATGTVEVDKHYYVYYLLFDSSPQETENFKKSVEATIRSWQDKKEQALQVLRLHISRAAQSLDPRIGCDRTSGIVIKMLYEGLMRTNENGEIEKAIAESVTISDDMKKYTFKLKKTFWSNGSPLTAHDFEYAWKKVLEPDFSSPYSFLFFPIKNAEAAKRGEISVREIGVKALDDRTLIVELDYPTKYFLNLTASWFFSPLCREIDQKHPGWAYHSGSSHVCNGPFKLDIWKLNDDLQVIKNPFYWDAEHVYLDRIQMTVCEDEKKSAKMFLNGELDFIGDPLTKVSIAEVKESNRTGALQTEDDYYGLFWLQLNIKKAPLNNIKIRQALSHAINRKHLIENVLHSNDKEALSFFHPPRHYDLSSIDGNLKKAKELFEEGLKELGIKKENLPPFEFSHGDIEEQELVTYEIGNTWQKVFDIEVKYKKHVWNTYFEKLHREEFMFGCCAWYPRFEDMLYYFNLIIFREEAIHVTNWKKAEFNKLADKARECLDEKKKIRYLEACEKILLEEMPVIPIIYQKFRYLKNPKLKGYVLSNINQIDFRKAYLEDNK